MGTVFPGQVLTTPECFKRCLLKMQGAEHAMQSNSCSWDTASLPKEADIKLSLPVWHFFFVWFPHPLLPFKFLKKIFYQFPVFKHWAEITKISQWSVYVHGSIPSTGCSENSPVSWSEQLRNWAQSPFDQRMISLVWKHQRNSEGYHITV